MTFPNITFKHTHVDPDYRLQTLVTDKFASLHKYLGEAPARCEVEFEKMVAHQNGPICRIEANLWRGSHLSRAEATCDTFEKAIDEVRGTLEDELSRHHDKRVNVLRRSARKLKEMVRFSK